jgi:RNA polymerase sigma-70 factor (ECF subfamily)
MNGSADSDTEELLHPAPMTRREQAVLLAQALARLPRDYRKVLTLHRLEGGRFAEIAHRMGRGVSSVEKLWVRALDRLRRSLKGAL